VIPAEASESPEAIPAPATRAIGRYSYGASARSQLIVGTYTETLSHVRGIADGVVIANYSGEVGDASTVRVRNPSWLTASVSGAQLYCVSELAPPELGRISVLDRDESGNVSVRTSVESGGSEPAHLVLDPTENYLVVANYGNGAITVLPRLSDGALGSAVDRVVHSGSGTHPIRQTGAHPHHVCFDPQTGNLLVTDLGLDAIVVYSLSRVGKLSELSRIQLERGAGPRHCVFHPDGSQLFVVNELNNSVVQFSRTETGFTMIRSESTVPAGYTGTNQAAAIRIAPDGTMLYVSNRGHDSVAVFPIDRATGLAEAIQFVPSGGRTPRDCIVSPDGMLLHVANQDSHSVATFEIAESGWLSYRGSVNLPSPVCLMVLA
jgi:6-phosphogluconolactonase